MLRVGWMVRIFGEFGHEGHGPHWLQETMAQKRAFTTMDLQNAFVCANSKHYCVSTSLVDMLGPFARRAGLIAGPSPVLTSAKQLIPSTLQRG